MKENLDLTAAASCTATAPVAGLSPQAETPPC
jgi:hypothetical protein